MELRGFEPLTPSMRTRCATSLRHSPCGYQPSRPVPQRERLTGHPPSANQNRGLPRSDRRKITPSERCWRHPPGRGGRAPHQPAGRSTTRWSARRRRLTTAGRPWAARRTASRCSAKRRCISRRAAARRACSRRTSACRAASQAASRASARCRRRSAMARLRRCTRYPTRSSAVTENPDQKPGPAITTPASSTRLSRTKAARTRRRRYTAGAYRGLARRRRGGTLYGRARATRRADGRARTTRRAGGGSSAAAPTSASALGTGARRVTTRTREVLTGTDRAHCAAGGCAAAPSPSTTPAPPPAARSRRTGEPGPVRGRAARRRRGRRGAPRSAPSTLLSHHRQPPAPRVSGRPRIAASPVT